MSTYNARRLLPVIASPLCSIHQPVREVPTPVATMMEESEYHDEGALLDEALFHFDNEQEEAAAMDHLNDTEPCTPPYNGFADPSASAAAPAPGQRLHFGSANAWEQSSPPDLSYSPSPGPTSAFQYRQHPASSQRFETDPQQQHFQQYPTATDLGQEDDRQVYQRHRHRSPAQYSPHLTSDLEQDPLDQYPGSSSQRGYQRARSRTHRLKHDARRKTSDVAQSASGYSSQEEGRRQHLRSNSHRQDYAQPGTEYHREAQQVDTRGNGSRASHDGHQQEVLPSSQHGDNRARGASASDDQEYVVIPEEDVLEMMYNGDEESRVTAERLRAQVVQAAIQNGKVLLMVTKATGQWWTGNEMRKRRKAVANSVYNTAGQVLSGAGHVIMTSTPLGGIYDSMSTNISRFRAAPLSYTLQGLRLGIGGRTQCQPDPPSQPEVSSDDVLINVDENEDGFIDMFSEE